MKYYKEPRRNRDILYTIKRQEKLTELATSCVGTVLEKHVVVTKIERRIE
jgi:hypothetical protein